jgi:uncharacterized protein (DUF427 family)
VTESAWDHPRPPRAEETARRVRVVFDDERTGVLRLKTEPP